MSTAIHRLEGLEPDNLLAFLALLGLLRSLETAEPDWRPRVHWEGAPFRPVLSLTTGKSAEEVAEEAARGCATLARDHDFADQSNLTFGREHARRLLQETATPATASRAALLDALFSDGACKDKEDKILAPPLCAMFGQGHQHFLTRLRDVPHGVLPKSLQNKKPPPDLNTPDRIVAALFQPWKRQDKTDGFRWDPAENRQYAYRFKDPSTDPGSTVHGANRLAAVGLAALPGAAVERRGRVRFLTLGSRLAERGRIEIRWPIWKHPTSLTALQALMAHPAMAMEPPDGRFLARLGVAEVRRSVRISVGKFFNFTRADVVGVG